MENAGEMARKEMDSDDGGGRPVQERVALTFDALRKRRGADRKRCAWTGGATHKVRGHL
jgi:hypothetical protein